MKLGFLFFILVQLSMLSPTEGLTWTVQPTSATGIQGENVSFTWTADLDNNETWSSVRVSQEVQGVINKQAMIRESKTTGRYVYPAYNSRGVDLILTASLNGTLLTSVFTMKNLNRSTDEHLYVLRIAYKDSFGEPDSHASLDLQLTVLVPPTITGPNPKIVTVNESQTAQLDCTVQGNPTPQVNWTKNGVHVGSGVYTTPAVAISDDNTCYTCIAYNGVLDVKTANVCLNVQYKPRSATILSDRSTLCQNSKVNLTCTSGPAKPAPSSYDFYNNDVLVGTSAANVYEATSTAGLPDVNKFVCVPRNLVGGSLENGSVEVAAKVTPTVTQTLGNTETVVEGSNVTLACTASGTPTLNVTWTRTGKPDVPGLEYPIVDIKRGDAGLYQCTVNNGAECPINTADIDVIVNYKPESTGFTISPSNEKFCQGNQITLMCTADAKPLAQYSLYLNNQLVQGGSTTGVFNVQLNEKGDNIFTCVPNNIVGAGQNTSIQVSVKVSPIIVTTTPSQEIREGSSHTLYCNVQAQGEYINVTWHKVGSGQVSSTGVYTIPSVTRAESGSYECRAHTGNGCEVKSTTTQIIVISAPNISNIIVTEGSLTVTWSNLLLPHNNIAKCLIYVKKSFHGVNWMKSSNTSHASSITCSISELQPSTLYHIQYILQIYENYVNGTIYIGTSAKGANSNHSTCNIGVSSTIYVAVIVVAVAVIVLLILVVIWMRFQVKQKNKRINSKKEIKTEVPLQTSFSTSAPSLNKDTVYENEGFIFRKTKTDGDITLYEQVRSRGRVVNQDVSGAPSFPMEDLQTKPGKLERNGGAATDENQLESQYYDPSYQSLDQRQMKAAKRVQSNQGSYGHLMDFTRRPDNNTVASPQERNPLYQELQPENRSKHYQSLQDMQRPAFNV